MTTADAQYIYVDSGSKKVIVNPRGTIGPTGPTGPQGPQGDNPTVNAYTDQGPFTIRSITQSAYDALTPDPDTLYLITGP